MPFPRCHAYETWNIFYKMILKFSQNQWCSNKLYTPKWSTINSESTNNYFAAFSTVKKLFYDKWNLLLPESTMWCLQRSIFKYLNWGAAIANWMSKKYKPNFTWIKVAGSVETLRKFVIDVRIYRMKIDIWLVK